jgi:hypothetical protein
MSGLSDYSAKSLLNFLTGQKAMAALPAVFLALMTAVDTDAGTGGTEVSGGAYARVQVAGSGTTNGSTTTSSAVLHFASVPAWITVGMTVYNATTPGAIVSGQTVLSIGASTVTLTGNVDALVNNADTIVFSAFGPASGSAPSQIANVSTITFPQATTTWGTVIAFELRDASSSGNLLLWDYLGNFPWLPCTVSAASPGVITAKGHGFSNGDLFVFSTEYGGTAPSFSAGTYSGILAAAGVTTDTLNVTSVNTSSTGSGAIRKITQQSIPQNVTASFQSSALTATAA